MNSLLALLEHTEDCDKYTGAGTACTCGIDRAMDVYNQLINDNAALRARAETAEREREELFKVAVLAVLTVEEMGYGEIKGSAQKLDHALANGFSDDLWERVNAAALKGGQA